MIRFAYSTNAFTRYSLEEALRLIGRLGFDGVELVADTPHLFVPAVMEWQTGSAEGVAGTAATAQSITARSATTGSALESLITLVHAAKLPVSNVNANTARGTPHDNAGWTLSDPDTAGRDSAVRNVCGAIDIAAAVGAPSISVAGGQADVHASMHEGRRFFRESLSRLLPYARARGIRVGIEAEPGLVISTTSDTESCLSEMRDENLGANLDIGHCIVVGENPRESIRRLAGRIWHVHLEDIRGREHFHRVPGEGEVDFATVFRALISGGYEGFVTLELYTYPHDPEGAGQAGLAHLRTLLETLAR